MVPLKKSWNGEASFWAGSPLSYIVSLLVTPSWYDVLIIVVGARIPQICKSELGLELENGPDLRF